MVLAGAYLAYRTPVTVAGHRIVVTIAGVALLAARGVLAVLTASVSSRRLLMRIAASLCCLYGGLRERRPAPPPSFSAWHLRDLLPAACRHRDRPWHGAMPDLRDGSLSSMCRASGFVAQALFMRAGASARAGPAVVNLVPYGRRSSAR